MRQQHGEVDIDIAVGVTDLADLLGCVLNIDQGADELFALGLFQDGLRQDADEEYAHAVDLFDVMGVEKPHAVELQVHVGIDDREGGALFQKQQMSKAVVHLVIAQCHHVRRQQIHDLNGGDTLKLAVDQRAAEHVAGDGVNDVLLLAADLVDIPGQPGNTADQLLVHLFGQKVAVEIIGVQDREFFQDKGKIKNQTRCAWLRFGGKARDRRHYGTVNSNVKYISVKYRNSQVPLIFQAFEGHQRTSRLTLSYPMSFQPLRVSLSYSRFM